MRRVLLSVAILAMMSASGCHCDSITPLVLKFDNAPVVFRQSDRSFDLGEGANVITDWPTAKTPWLALDRNGNGSIDDAGELFGSATPSLSGATFSNGFEALGELDSNGDGQITAADSAWPKLLVWSDYNNDRVSSGDELVPLSMFGVVSIDLAYMVAPTCDARGNCEAERAPFRYVSADGEERQGVVVDVHLQSQEN